MSDQSSDELERQAEAARQRMAGTAESIRKKLSAGQLIDEFADMFTGGDLSGAARNLKSQIRDNPLPIVLVGAGVAWLVLGRGAPSGESAPARRHATPQPPRTRERSKDSDGGASVMSSVAEGARTAAETVGDTVGGMADSLSATADRLRHSMLTGMPHSSRHLKDSISGAAQQEPLLIAALGLTVGAVVGAMLPASDLEKEQIGPYSDRLRKGAKEMLDKGMDSAERVASKTYDALKEEADKQGLAPGEGPSVGERVGNVVRSAAQSAEDAVRDEMGRDDYQRRT